LPTSTFFLPTSLVVKAREGDNDGIVSKKSALRGRMPFDVWLAAHNDMIGHNMDCPIGFGVPAFNHLSGYRRIVTHLRTLPLAQTTRSYRCAVQRHGLSVGANPTRQLSLRPAAIGAVVEAMKRLKPSVQRIIY